MWIARFDIVVDGGFRKSRLVDNLSAFSSASPDMVLRRNSAVVE
jgi:hypothetical protein